jgi:hypothetical protein
MVSGIWSIGSISTRYGLLRIASQRRKQYTLNYPTLSGYG